MDQDNTARRIQLAVKVYELAFLGFGKKNKGKAKFDEKKHTRGPDGKFTGGTLGKALGKIKEVGEDAKYKQEYLAWAARKKAFDDAEQKKRADVLTQVEKVKTAYDAAVFASNFAKRSGNRDAAYIKAKYDLIQKTGAELTRVENLLKQTIPQTFLEPAPQPPKRLSR